MIASTVLAWFLLSGSPFSADPAIPDAQAATPRKKPAAVARPKVFDLLCTGMSEVRANNGNVTSRWPAEFNIRIDYKKMTADAYGTLPTVGDEMVFGGPHPLTAKGNLLSFPGYPLGMSKTVTPVQIDLQSGAIHYRNAHQWAAAFGAIPVFETYELVGRCRIVKAAPPAIPAP